MNKSLILALLLLLVFPYTARGDEFPAVSAKAAVVMEVNSGVLLYGQNESELLPPASTTKILTALLALDMTENRDMPYVISEEAAAVGESSIWLTAGEALTLDELLRGALIHSGNDACYAIAQAVAGSEPLFVHWMNQKAAALGAYDISFCNTNGLPSEEHLVSAEALGRIAVAAMKDPCFAEIVQSKYTAIGQGERYRYFKNTNKLLWQDDSFVGVKTGTTEAAGPCLVGAKQDGSSLFVSVVLDSPDRWGESAALLNAAAANRFYLPLFTAGEKVAWKNGIFYETAAAVGVLIPQSARDTLSLRWYMPDEQGNYRVTLQNGDEILA